jgi:hypothetical protein
VVIILSVVAVGAGFAADAVGQPHGLLAGDHASDSADLRGSASSDFLGTANAASVEEPALFSLRTLGAVVGAFLLALLIVAVVRRMDR